MLILQRKKKYLIDSNAYFRLGDALYPLFEKTVTEKDNAYCACILCGTFQEYLYASRLHSKFDWVLNKSRSDDRKKGKTHIRKRETDLIHFQKDFVYDQSKQMGLGCGIFDVECLVSAMVMNYTLVTDDLDLIILAKEYECPVLSTIQLLGLFYQSSQILKKDVLDTIQIWTWFEDLPSAWERDYKDVFGEDYPIGGVVRNHQEASQK